MLASNFYRQDLAHGKGIQRKDPVSAPKLSAGNSKSTVPSTRGRPRGRLAVATAPQRRQILFEVNRNRSRNHHDHDDNEGNSDKVNENEELEDLAPEQQ